MKESIKVGFGISIVVMLIAVSIAVPMAYHNNSDASFSTQSSIPWYTSLENYAKEHGTTVEQLTANWTSEDWWHWYKYEGNPIWGSTNITDTMLATDWVHLSNVGNLTWGANYDIQAKYNATSGMLDWIGQSNNFSAWNLKLPASYIIWKDGSTIYVTNGTTGKIDYSGTDAATVIQSAIDNGDTIYIKKGEYIISSVLQPDNGSIIFGDGISTILKCADNTQINVFEIKGISGNQKHDVTIMNLAIDGNAANNTWNGATTALQCGIYTEEAIRVKVINCEIKNTWSHCVLFNTNSCYGQVIGCYLHDGKRSGVSIHASSHDCLVSNSVISEFIESGHSGIVCHADCRNFNIQNNYIYRCNRGIWIHDNEFGGIIADNDIINSYAGAGIRIGNTGYSSDHNKIINNKIEGGVDYGIEILEGSYNLIEHNDVHDVGTTTPHGIAVSVGSYNQIIRNFVYNITYRGIRLFSNAENNTVEKNTLYDDTGIIILDEGTDNTIRHNIGYTTENSGTYEITGDGTSTSFTVSHGLAATPTIVLVTPTNSSMASATWWVSAKASTTFTITFSTAPASGTKLSFDWYAEV